MSWRGETASAAALETFAAAWQDKYPAIVRLWRAHWEQFTHRLAGGAVGFADAGAHALKGKAEPQRLWRATRVLSGVDGSQRVDGLEAPQIGRDAELRTIGPAKGSYGLEDRSLRLRPCARHGPGYFSRTR